MEKVVTCVLSCTPLNKEVDQAGVDRPLGERKR